MATKHFLNLRKKLFFVSLLLILIACNKEQQLQKNLKSAVQTYIQDIYPNCQVDSIKILNIDTLTDKSFATLNIVTLENKKNELENHYLYSSEATTAEERIDQYELFETLDFINDRIESWYQIYDNPTTDSVNLRYYFVATRISLHYTNATHNNEDILVAFPISSDFKVQEIVLGNQSE